MTQEALKLALEVNESMKDMLKQVNELIAENKALKEALAQEQEPVACIYKGHLYMAHEFQSGQVPVDSQPLYTTPPQRTEQELELEPAWPPATPPAHGRGWPLAEPPLANARECTWVGLTVNEIALINADYPLPQGFAKAIEAKLKEKNT